MRDYICNTLTTSEHVTIRVALFSALVNKAFIKSSFKGVNLFIYKTVSHYLHFETMNSYFLNCTSYIAKFYDLFFLNSQIFHATRRRLNHSAKCVLWMFSLIFFGINWFSITICITGFFMIPIIFCNCVLNEVVVYKAVNVDVNMFSVWQTRIGSCDSSKLIIANHWRTHVMLERKILRFNFQKNMYVFI